MADSLMLEHVALDSQGPTLSLSVAKGQCLSVLGPAAAGKSVFLRMLAGEGQPLRGSIKIPKSRAVAGTSEIARRSKPQTIARQGPGEKNADLVTEVLSALHLWDFRSRLVSDLSEAQATACELIELLCSGASLLLIDGHLDRLDPWVLDSVWLLLRKRMASGASLAIATNRPDIAARCDVIVVLRSMQLLFAGPPAQLIRSLGEGTVEVSTDNQSGVRALAAPFDVSVTETDDGAIFRAAEGQQLAAKMLLEGYGDVRYVVVKSPTLDEALRRL